MLQPQLRDYLAQHHVHYQVIPHVPTYTSQDTAESAHISGMRLAKTLIVDADNELKMVVMPAPYMLDMEELAESLGVNQVYLAQEKDFKSLFPRCEIGAMPPFGNLYGIEVFVSRGLANQQTFYFTGGNHEELIEMEFATFVRLVDPIIINRGFKLDTVQHYSRHNH